MKWLTITLLLLVANFSLSTASFANEITNLPGTEVHFQQHFTSNYKENEPNFTQKLKKNKIEYNSKFQTIFWVCDSQ